MRTRKVNGQTNGRTDRQTDRQGGPIYHPLNFVAGGIKMYHIVWWNSCVFEYDDTLGIIRQTFVSHSRRYMYTSKMAGDSIHCDSALCHPPINHCKPYNHGSLMAHMSINWFVIYSDRKSFYFWHQIITWLMLNHCRIYKQKQTSLKFE